MFIHRSSKPMQFNLIKRLCHNNGKEESFQQLSSKLMAQVSDAKDSNFEKPNDPRIEFAAAKLQSNSSSQQLTNFRRLLAQDVIYFHYWTKVCDTRAELLDVKTDALIQVKDCLLLEFGLSKQKTFKVIEFLPLYFFQQHLDLLR